MFGHKLQRQMLAIVASLLMSTIVVGSTVMPTDAVASPIQSATYA
ncbi:hypothetical protein [Sphingomicrobium nitratireducens]|nr:hypothetical protein [Sphingomicrobium nitratireducens]